MNLVSVVFLLPTYALYQVPTSFPKIQETPHNCRSQKSDASKFHTEDSQLLSPTIHNLVAGVTWLLGCAPLLYVMRGYTNSL